MAAALLCVLTLAGYLGRWCWFLDASSHFRVQYLAGLVVCLVLLAVARDRLFLVVAAAGFVLNAVEIAPWYVAAKGPAVDAAAPRLKLVCANVNSRNREHARLLDLVRDADPDVIIVIEASSPWAATLETIADEYPHTKAEIREDNFGIAIYSRLPFDEAEIVEYGSLGVPSIVATIRVDDTPVTIVATHPMPPRCSRYWRLRNEQFEAIAAARDEFGDRLIVAGDFNASVFSPCLAHFVKAMSTPKAKLRNTRRGFGVRPTWPTMCRPLLTPLDHIFVTDHFAVTECRTGPHIGSDHLPIRATLVLEE